MPDDSENPLPEPANLNILESVNAGSGRDPAMGYSGPMDDDLTMSLDDQGYKPTSSQEI